jgi:hypothetical protein
LIHIIALMQQDLSAVVRALGNEKVELAAMRNKARRHGLPHAAAEGAWAELDRLEVKLAAILEGRPVVESVVEPQPAGELVVMLPCPFCGGTSASLLCDPAGCAVTCKNCGACGPETRPDEAAALACWNGRV